MRTAIYTDAGAPSHLVPGKIQAVDENGNQLFLMNAKQAHSINVLELIAVAEACKYVSKNNLRDVDVYCDNATAITWLNKGAAKISTNEEVKEYELFRMPENEVIETIYGTWEHANLIRLLRGLQIRKKEGGKKEKIARDPLLVECDQALADKAIEIVHRLQVAHNINIKFYRKEDHNGQENPADFGNK